MTTKHSLVVIGTCLVLAAVAVATLYKICTPIVDATAVALDLISRSL